MKERYIIEVDRPEGMTRADMKEYIADAVGGWKGGYEADHPLVGHPMNVHVSAIPSGSTKLQSSAGPTPWGAVAVSQLSKGKT